MIASTRFGRVALLLAVLALPVPAGVGGGPTPAKGGTIAVTVVIFGTSVPLPNSVVGIPLLAVERFTDENGRFVIHNVAAGTYHVRVRRIGYAPHEMDVVVTAGDTVSAYVALTHVSVPLDGIRAVATKTCTDPGLSTAGRADSSRATINAVLQQVSQNAAQFRLLSQEYPFKYAVERRMTTVAGDGTATLRQVDTLSYGSETHWTYAPGRVVSLRNDPGPGGALQWVVHVPTFVNFAEPLFQMTHCFYYGGIEQVDGRPRVRVDFRALDTLRVADIDGTIHLDTATFQVVRVAINLTRVEGAVPRNELLGTSATSYFSEIAPSIPVMDVMVGRNALRPGSGPKPIVAETEEHRIIQFLFLNATPTRGPVVAPEHSRPPK